jgi:RNA polymerase sigma factor for flagellar operon FliA
MKTRTQADIQALWKEFSQKKDNHTRDLLIERYLPNVKYTAQRLHARLPNSVELDDLNSVGLLGLIDAINKFEPERGVLFETYCTQRIRGTILDDMRKSDWVPRLVRMRAQQISRATQKLETIFGRQPSEEELASELEVGMDEFYRIQHDANATVLISLDNDYSGSDGEESFREIDLQANKKSQDPFHEVLKKDLKENVTKGFSREEKLVIALYYYEEMTMKEIGNALGITESRVSQIHSSIIARLKSRLDKAILLKHP